MRWILIWSAIAAGLLIGWLFGGRQLTLVLDRVWTIRVASLPVSPLSYTNGTVQIGDRTMYMLIPTGNDYRRVNVTVRRDPTDRLVLSIAGKDFRPGPGTVSKDISGFPKYGLTAEPGDAVSFNIDRCFLSWPTPFETNFMTGASPSWKRNLYYRFVWRKPSGARLEIDWRYEQWFYRVNGWTGLGGMSNMDTTGLSRVDIAPVACGS